ncbi:hypothetical protein A4X09_0g4426 [Tilletia walkeri]|uniref:Uncharacterized protein n=1 Tax=Tilletia walkeri TaxID=117179 RepID=A0A8X7N7V6_9BASI|nr:hypothetical protein A4X09_0g4426 [Tilletia walkeri]
MFDEDLVAFKSSEHHLCLLFVSGRNLNTGSIAAHEHAEKAISVKRSGFWPSATLLLLEQDRRTSLPVSTSGEFEFQPHASFFAQTSLSLSASARLDHPILSL